MRVELTLLTFDDVVSGLDAYPSGVQVVVNMSINVLVECWIKVGFQEDFKLSSGESHDFEDVVLVVGTVVADGLDDDGELAVLLDGHGLDDFREEEVDDVVPDERSVEFAKDSRNELTLRVVGVRGVDDLKLLRQDLQCIRGEHAV